MAFLRAIAAGLIIFVAGTVNTVWSQRIVWTEYGNGLIRSANLDGSGQLTLVTMQETRPTGIAVDSAHQHLYWLHHWDNGTIPVSIRRANLDGSNLTELGPWFAHSLALDPTGVATGGVGKIYVGGSETFYLQRFNLDGSGVEVFTDYLGNDVNQHGISLDLAGERVFWSSCCSDDDTPHAIYKAGTDGANVEILARDLQPRGVVYNQSDDNVYWLSQQTQSIQRIDADGGAIVPLVSGVVDGYALALNSSLNKLIWSQQGGIWSANLDGTAAHQIVSLAQGEVRGIAIIVPEPTTLAMLLAALPLAYLACRRR